jgi:hypothetical protein
MLFAVGYIYIGTKHPWSLTITSWVIVTQSKFSGRYAWNPIFFSLPACPPHLVV